MSDIDEINRIMDARGSSYVESGRGVDMLVVQRRTEVEERKPEHFDASCDRCGGDVVVHGQGIENSPGALFVCTACVKEPQSDDWAERGRPAFAKELREKRDRRTGRKDDDKS